MHATRFHTLYSDSMTSVEEQHEEELRRPAIKRAHLRNSTTYVDVRIGHELRAIRTERDMSQPEVARAMKLPNGETHPTALRPLEYAADVAARLGQRANGATDKDVKTARDRVAKVVSKLEAAEKALLVSELVAVCRALNVHPGTVFERAGLAEPRFAVQSAIEADPTLTPDQRASLLTSYAAFTGRR
ncbi:MAG: hypothetical protein AB7L13_24955 [Acidimicrobiia bacterium]